MSLRDPLDDLLAEVPSYVVPDAAGALAAGARRRTRRRLAVLTCVLVLVALVGAAVSLLPRAGTLQPATDGQAGSPGYPSQVGKPLFLHDLPDRPGPLSAVIESDGLDWLAVAPDGRVWRVPQHDAIDSFPPALSADGRMLGYLEGTSTYVVRDLVTGAQRTYAHVSDNLELRSRTETWWVNPQAPAFWSPDDDQLLVRGGRWDDDHSTQFVLDADGSVHDVPGHGIPAGWVDDQSIAWLRSRHRSVSMVVSDLAGSVQRRVPLDLRMKRGGYLSQWSAVVAPGHDRIAILLADRPGTLATVSTGDGTLIRSEQVGADGSCSPAWAGDRPIFVQGYDSTVSLDTTEGQRLMVIDGRLGATCVLPALDALGGERHEGWPERLFGEGWLAWRWREAGLWALAALLLAGAAVLLVSRRRRLSG